MALNKEKDAPPAEDGGGGGGGLRRSFDANYPALIMNMEKVYDFENRPRLLCPACDRRHHHHHQGAPGPSPPPQCHTIRRDFCAHAAPHRRGTILGHCRCGGGGPGSSSVDSNLEREPLYDDGDDDDGHPGNGFGFDNFDLVTARKSVTSAAVTPDSSGTAASSYPPGLRTPELLASPP